MTMPLGLAERVTRVPPTGAGTLSVTVPVVDLVSPMVVDARLTAMLCGPTMIMAVPGRKPGAKAVTCVLPKAPGVTGTVTLRAFAGTMTLA